MNGAAAGAPSGHRAPIEALIAELGGRAESLWTRLAPRAGRSSARVLFTAVEPGAGTTLLACVTAWELAQNLRRRTVLLEANVHRPAAAAYLGVAPIAGLSDLLDGRADFARCVRDVDPGKFLRLVPGGTPRAAIPGELLTPGARNTFAELAADTEVLIIDAPALSEGPQARLMFDQVDGVVLVLRARRTLKRDLVRASEQIEAAGVPLLGAILNRFRPEARFLAR